tara:strand:- start:201 stop:404 length:204 start_codon:yes stop_codon:yes gene_type:complete
MIKEYQIVIAGLLIAVAVFSGLAFRPQTEYQACVEQLEELIDEGSNTYSTLSTHADAALVCLDINGD